MARSGDGGDGGESGPMSPQKQVLWLPFVKFAPHTGTRIPHICNTAGLTFGQVNFLRMSIANIIYILFATSSKEIATARKARNSLNTMCALGVRPRGLWRPFFIKKHHA
jgi:hypothetical protein